MKLFSSLGLNITFLQNLSGSAGSSPLSDLVIDLALPHFLFYLFFSLSVIHLYYFLLISLVIRDRVCLVCEWPQGLLKQHLLNQNVPTALAEERANASSHLNDIFLMLLCCFIWPISKSKQAKHTFIYLVHLCWTTPERPGECTQCDIKQN